MHHARSTHLPTATFRNRKHDYSGSIHTTVDQSGNVDGYDDYYPFGLTMPGRSSNTGNPNDNYKYTGHELDDEAGLNILHMNARGLDLVLGRTLQIDPHSDSYPGWSPYAYAFNNPVNFNDPTGMDPCEKGDWWCQLNEFIATILSSSSEVNLKIDVGIFSEEAQKEQPKERQMMADAMLQDLKNQGEAAERIYNAADNIPGADVALNLVEGDLGEAALDAAGFIPIGRAGKILGKSTDFINITKGNSITNFKVGTDLTSFMNQLSSAVGKTWSYSKDGVVKILERGNIKYVARPAKGNKAPTVEIFKNDRLIQKYRLDK